MTKGILKLVNFMLVIIISMVFLNSYYEYGITEKHYKNSLHEKENESDKYNDLPIKEFQDVVIEIRETAAHFAKQNFQINIILVLLLVIRLLIIRLGRVPPAPRQMINKE